MLEEEVRVCEGSLCSLPVFVIEDISESSSLNTVAGDVSFGDCSE